MNCLIRHSRIGSFVLQCKPRCNVLQSVRNTFVVCIAIIVCRRLHQKRAQWVPFGAHVSRRASRRRARAFLVEGSERCRVGAWATQERCRGRVSLSRAVFLLCLDADLIAGISAKSASRLLVAQRQAISGVARSKGCLASRGPHPLLSTILDVFNTCSW